MEWWSSADFFVLDLWDEIRGVQGQVVLDCAIAHFGGRNEDRLHEPSLPHRPGSQSS